MYRELEQKFKVIYPESENAKKPRNFGEKCNS